MPLPQADFTYWNIQTDRASAESFDENDPFKTNLLSVETRPDLTIGDVLEFSQVDPERFAHALTVLRPRDREIMLHYYIVRKTQTWIAELFGIRQTDVWIILRKCRRVLAASLALGGTPTAAQIAVILGQSAERISPYNGGRGSRVSLTNYLCRFLEGGIRRVSSPFHVKKSTAERLISREIEKLMQRRELEARSLGELLDYKLRGLRGIGSRKGKRRVRIRVHSGDVGQWKIDPRKMALNDLFAAEATG